MSAAAGAATCPPVSAAPGEDGVSSWATWGTRAQAVWWMQPTQAEALYASTASPLFASSPGEGVIRRGGRPRWR